MLHDKQQEERVVWGAVGEDAGFWSGRGGLQALKRRLEGTSRQPHCGLCLGQVRLGRQLRGSGWGPALLALTQMSQSPSWTASPGASGAWQPSRQGCCGVGVSGEGLLRSCTRCCGEAFYKIKNL